MSKDLKTANVQFCLTILKELLDSVPSQEGDINWDELAQKKELASKAWEHLSSLFGVEPCDVVLVGCQVEKPAIRS